MRSAFSAILFILFIVTCYSLSIKGYEHLQSASDQQAYLNELLNIENSLATQIQSLELLVNTVNNNASSYQGLQTIQTQALQYGLQEERKKIYQMTSSVVLPIEKKTWDCKLLTQNQTQAINKQISETQNNILKLKQKMAAEPDCQRNNEIEMQIQFLSLYIDHLAKQVGSTCGSSVTTVKTVLVPNSQNQYYVYGTQTQQAYNTNLQNLLNQGYTKLECPPEAPYPKGNSCVGCPQDKLHFFDLTQLLCLTCPDGFVFQTANHTCLRKQFNSNTQAQNFIGVLPTTVTGLQTCPLNSPFWNGTTCIGCPSGAFFDFGSMQCKTCPTDTVFDPTTHLCSYKRFNSNINANTINYCCGTLPHDANLATCPPQAPFFNGKQCIGCALPAFFSLQTMSCSLCPDGQGFSLLQRKCIDNKYFQVIYTSALTSDVANYMGTPTSLNQTSYQKVSTCPADHPFFNGVNCISCPLPNYFNFESNHCQVCPAQYKFDVSTKRCIKMSSPQMNNNMDTITNYIGKIPDFNPAFVTCPSDRPFYSGGQCTVCSLPYYIDFNTNTCTQCQNGYMFNTGNRQCIVGQPNYYTDTKATNIFYNGDFNNVITDINKQKTQFVGIQQCPSDKPYFNASTNTCITCPTEFPLFDYKFNRCIACTGQSFYNADSRTCLLEGRVSATVQRMMMNTVGWL